MMSNLNESFNGPQLVWVIEPENKIRFRYESEGGSHGGLAGKTGKKTYPTLELIKYHGQKQILVKVSLYTEDKKEHVLEFKGKKYENRKCYIEEKLQEDNRVVFKNLQILSKKKDEIEKLLMERKLGNLKTGMSRAVRAQFEKSYTKDVKTRARAILNSVRLHFQAFEADRPNVPLCSLFSDVICNQKAAAKGDLRICRLSQVAGSWKGGDEVILLCEKVQKDNIKVKFYETNECGDVVWQDYGLFSPIDVHYQVAIAFKTPPYQNNVEKTVFVCLERNEEISDPREFTYKPDEPSSKKRKLNTHHFVTIPPENVESDEISSMSVSSPEYDNNAVSGGIQNIFNLSLDDANMIEEINAFFNSSDNLDGNSDEYDLPFENLIDYVSDINNGPDRIWNQSLQIDGVIMDDVDAEKIPLSKEVIKNQNLDIIGIDGLFKDFTLKDECEKDSSHVKKEFGHSRNLLLNCQHKKKICPHSLLKRDNYGNTLLHIAVLFNKNIVPILKISSIAKIDLVNLQNFKNQTVLHLAAEKNKCKEVKFLLKYGSDPNFKDSNGNNCYHIAAMNNFPGIIQEINRFSRFLHKVSDFNDKGLTPIHLAIMQNNPVLFDLLKFHMIDANIAEKKAGKSLLHYAIDFQPSLLPKILEMSDIDVNLQDFEGNTPLHIACDTGNIEAVKQLLQFQADPLIKNFKQDSNSIDLENSDEDASDGQFPADLTTNIEILKLLSTMEKIEDTLNIQSFCSFQVPDPDVCTIPCQIIEKLSKYLDEGKKWKTLTPFFLDVDVMESLSLSPSPAKALLDYIKKEEQYNFFERLKTALEYAGLTDAVKIIDEHQVKEINTNS